MTARFEPKSAQRDRADLLAAIRRAARQEQFLEVVSAEEARARFTRHLDLSPLPSETVALAAALGRVLARDITAPIDVPPFDRANVDGFALRSADTVGASDGTPRRFRLNGEVIVCGHAPALEVTPGSATTIATGGMLPRGADAVVMIEHTDLVEEGGMPAIDVRRAVAPGQFISYAGSDIARGEVVLRRKTRLSSREIGMLAACGLAEIDVVRRPKVAVLSTGDELAAPGVALGPARVYDSNGAIIAAAVAEAGGEAVAFGAFPDDEAALEGAVRGALAACDLVVLSGGTSKGAGDLSHRIVSKLGDILVHGVALKPGKPLCLAVSDGKAVVVLPGFPTSAIFTFHEFVTPVIRAYAGLPPEQVEHVAATLPMRVASERGRTEFVMVSLTRRADGTLAAYPIAKGSGAVTAFSQADGFVAVDQHAESVPAGAAVEVQLIGRWHRLPDMTIIGSHCVGLDVIAGRLQSGGISVKLLNVGSTGGLAAAKRGECDIAPIHLMDPATGEYNRPLLTEELELVPGYRRLQGIVFRKGDPRFERRTAPEAIAAALADPECIMVNRNAGSGTRILTDRALDGAKPPGYWSQPKSHNAVAVAVAQSRADWGVAIESVARQYDLGFIPMQDEHYDFVVPKARLENPGVKRFRAVLADESVRDALRALKFGI
jgi:putative molybdopterin biosynthesis protein